MNNNNQKNFKRPPQRGNQYKPTPQGQSANRGVSRGAALRAQKRGQDDAHKAMSQYLPAAPQPQNSGERANKIVDNFDKLKITFLGGQEAIGEKNMQVLEWQNDAIILDCGNHLGVDLPGVN